MNHKNKYWVALIASMWMSVTVTVLEGLRPLSNQKPSVNVFANEESTTGKKWALLVAGSNSYANYRHQADICHAYQILKRGGLKDENIVVFMYDDIAYNPKNPRPGVLINHPNGPDVYYGVPKDYIGDYGNLGNLLAVLSGNKSATKGGSGKVLDTGPDDTIFIFYADHGTPGSIGMPDGGFLYGNDFVDALKKKHDAKSYKKMVIYMEACDAGSMFEGLLPNDINIYVTTASNASENSFAFYCPDTYPPAPPEYTTCLGDMYSISWMEDSERNDMTKENLKQQYETVRRRTLLGQTDGSSRVSQYGDLTINNDSLVTYIGADPTNVNDDHESYLDIYPASFNDHFNITSTTNVFSFVDFKPPTTTSNVGQRDAHLIYLKTELERASNGLGDKLKAQKELEVEIAHRKHVDHSVHLISNLLFGEEKGSIVMVHVRAHGLPLVDDWDCLKTLIKTYESRCGTLSSYGRKYSRAFANMCNHGISEKQMVAASLQACQTKN